VELEYIKSKVENIEMCLFTDINELDSITSETFTRISIYLARIRRNNSVLIKSNNMNASVDIIETLGYDCTVEVCLHLSPKDLCRLSQTCKAFQEIALSNYVWKKLYDKFYGDWTFLTWDLQLRDILLAKIKPKFPIYYLFAKTFTKNIDIRNCKVLHEGVLSGITGYTKNLTGNLTRYGVGSGFTLTFKNKTVEGEVQIGAGTEYNEATVCSWFGTYQPIGTIMIDEKLVTHPGVFKYTLAVLDHHTLTGSYIWTINDARGTCEYKLPFKETLE